MTARLIVNADDYGLTEGVSEGIRAAHREGVVTSTTVMVNCVPAAEAVQAARAECPALGLGVHLVLTAGAPIRPARSVRSLVASNGCFIHLDKWTPQRFATVDAVQLKDEWRAQIDAFMTLAGKAPTHLDSHHHISYRHPGLLAVMLDLAAEMGVPVRHPVGFAQFRRELGDGDQASVPATTELAERMAEIGHPAGLISHLLIPTDVPALSVALHGGVGEAGVELVTFAAISPAPPTGTRAQP